ncbi:2619_t:CDS:10 [Ambispora gerdemannii]|uniref:Glutamyl-tRNA(Gln) amidotransferase subunit A, mitochondrial n=1 Tax=Ambispora gerdemannii TaxID=144530 RepID=A0A9N9BLH1_9GLOM|nr:2619_t:CDS:10 [Ambispora gerdemannii]
MGWIHLYDCLWKGCCRYSPGTANRSTILKHLKIHFPIEPDSSTIEESSQVKLDQRRNFLTQRVNVSSDADGEAIGIPLTACLILRNMSRSKKTIPYFMAYETELSDILAKCTKRYFFTSIQLSNLQKSQFLSLSQAIELIKQKKVSPVVLTQKCMKQINAFHQINAFIQVKDYEKILDQAKQAEERIQRGEPKGILDGIPIACKDIFCTKNLYTTCGSTTLKDFQSTYNSTVVELLEKSGAIIIGKTNMDEFGMGSANVYSAYGLTYNPLLSLSQFLESIEEGDKRVAGGSSGGSAAAVASGMCFAALGSDTGGSVRLPASYCGVVGFKPSYGQCSRWGLTAYANSLDTVGLITRTVDDTKLVYDLISKFDKKDSTSLPPKFRSTNKNSNQYNIDTKDLSGLRVGVPQEYFVSELCEDIINLWRKGISYLNSHGATIVPVSCPNTKYALPVYYILAPAEASSNLARYDGVRYGFHTNTKEKHTDTRDQGLGEEVKRPQRVRQLIRKDFNNVFSMPNPLLDDNFETLISEEKLKHGVDVLIAPVAISTAPKIRDSLNLSDTSSENLKSDSYEILDSYVNDVMTTAARIPSMSIPFGISSNDGFPIGLQLIAQYGNEETLFQVAKVIERDNYS